ncbi:glycosyl transferase [Dictyobacter alpinus]|uniref:Glycosyl transferase n=1 Tax=Dictyobacter alpinus TaxID=2014873 RepID=A0A402B3Z9_9CHLR|nr:glycosyltransferase family 9 protein [Dictyobacter alpinus]GCE26068.1 glycosyl transferase [Dictyobacter alpinus]
MRMLVMRPGAIGDTLVTFPLLQYLHKTRADLALTFVGNAAVLPLLQAFNLADEVSSYEERIWSRLFLPADSRGQQQLHSKLQQIERAICWLRDPDGTVEANLRAAGIDQISIAPGRPVSQSPQPIVDYLASSSGERTGIASYWQPPGAYAWQPVADSPWGHTIAIHPGSGGATKCWPLAHFAAVITALWQQAIPVLLCIGPAEQARFQELQRLLPAPPSPELLHSIVDAPLTTLAQILRQCRGYLGNDAGITHLAALLGLPTVALFGPSSPVIWRPIGERVQVIYNPSLAAISPSSVTATLLKI